MKNIILFLLSLICTVHLYSQDPQYSQFYANALYLSPAFAGSEQNTRAFFGSRYQWPGLDASFISSTASVDHYFEKYKSGVGFIANSDISTAAKLNSTEVGVMYAYHADLSKKIAFRPGIQISYVSRSIDFSRLTFGAQYNDNGFVGGSTQEKNNPNTVSYADISAGGLLYSKKFWIGFSANHINQPDQSFIQGQSPLPMKASIFGGYKFSFTPDWKKRYINPDEEKSITPVFMYKAQGKSDQLDIGLYGRYNTLVLGFWYRGLPVKVYAPERSNNDALVFLIGIVHNQFNIGYSYDLTISKLTPRSGGSHEITVTYSIKHPKRKVIQKKLACPKF